MNLFEFTDICDLEIHIYHTPNAVSNWIINIKKPFRDVFFKTDENDCIAHYPAGWGKTTDEALLDLIKNIKPYKLIVSSKTSSCSKPRKQFNIPKDLTI